MPLSSLLKNRQKVGSDIGDVGAVGTVGAPGAGVGADEPETSLATSPQTLFMGTAELRHPPQ